MSNILKNLEKISGVSDFSIENQTTHKKKLNVGIQIGDFVYDELVYRFIYTETKDINMLRVILPFQFEGVTFKGEEKNIYSIANEFNLRSIGIKAIITEHDNEKEELYVEFSFELIINNNDDDISKSNLKTSLIVLSDVVGGFVEILDSNNINYLSNE